MKEFEDNWMFPEELAADDFRLDDFKCDSLTRKISSFYKMGCDCYKFIDHYLPYTVGINVHNPEQIDQYVMYVIDELSGKWYLSRDIGEYKYIFRFEEETDAVLFRLRW